MKTFFKVFLQYTIIAALLPASAFASEQDDRIHLAEVIAPAALIAAYTCTSISEAVLAKQFLDAVRSTGTQQPLAKAQIKALLARFDEITEQLCRETQSLFSEHKKLVANQFARNHTMPVSRGWLLFLSGEKTNQWAVANNEFLIKSLPLIALYKVVNALSPQLLSEPLRVNNLYQFTLISDPVLKRQFEVITPGRSVGMVYRRMISLLLQDEAFSSVVPPRYDVAKLRHAESSTREEGAKLLETIGYGDPSMDSLGDQFARTTLHFGSFDVMRGIGMEGSYTRAVEAVKKLQP